MSKEMKLRKSIYDLVMSAEVDGPTGFRMERIKRAEYGHERQINRLKVKVAAQQEAVEKCKAQYRKLLKGEAEAEAVAADQD